MYDQDLIDHEYRNRVKIGVIAVQVVAILVFRYWPETWMQPGPLEVPFNDREIVTIDPAAITTQAPAPPAPTRPFVPVDSRLDPVIDVTDELELALEPVNLNPITEGVAQNSGDGDTGSDAPRIAQRPTRPPGVVRIVEPVIPESARKAKVKAEITVRFLVGVAGEVEDAEIVDIKVYNEKMKAFEKADDIGHGLKEVTLQAAQSWRFRPAQVGDEKVRAWFTGLFTIGN